MLLSDRTHYAFVIEEGLKVEDFYRERHREVFESMLALFTAGEPIDVLTVTEHLRARGRPARSSSAPSAPSSRSPTTTARRTSARSARSSEPRSASGRSCRQKAAPSPAPRPASPTSMRSPAGSSRGT
jgi:hypothetical protein